jgi:hypothetical protein
MKKLLASLAAAVILLVIVAGIAYTATAIHHHVNAALTDGSDPTPHSVEEPGLVGSGVKPVLAGGGGVKPILAGSGVKPVLAGGGGVKPVSGARPA